MSIPTTPSGPPGPPASAPFDRRPRDLSAGYRACPCIQSTDVLKEEDDGLLYCLKTKNDHFLSITTFCIVSFAEYFALTFLYSVVIIGL